MIKAIETAYDGRLFRSRLEARWAVFFRALGMRYVYEPEGFDLDGTWYLPDFYLPRMKMYVEIKPDKPSDDAQMRCAKLARATGENVLLLAGQPGGPDYIYDTYWYDLEYNGKLYYGRFPELETDILTDHTGESLAEFLQERDYPVPYYDGRIETWYALIAADVDWYRTKHGCEHPFRRFDPSVDDVAWVDYGSGVELGCYIFDIKQLSGVYDTPLLNAAYTAAQSARF